MNALAPINSTNAVLLHNGKQVDLIRRTVASDCNPQEFDLYMEVARRVRLDPLRKQIYAVVYSKDNPSKRKMSIITAIDGFRAIAARNKDYRPAEDEAKIVTDEKLISTKNPLGIVKAVVRVFKFGPDREWYPVVGEAYWDEFAPIKTANSDGDFIWIDTGEVWPDTGKPKKKKVPKDDSVEVKYEPEGKWKSMPHLMLAKCAEAQALRRGWPEDLSGIYAPEEMDKSRLEDIIETTATEVADQFISDKKLEAMGGKNVYTVQWEPTAPLEQVPAGAFADRVAEFVSKCQSLPDLIGWKETNTTTLNRFWAEHKSDALALKKIMEDRIAVLAEANKTGVAA